MPTLREFPHFLRTARYHLRALRDHTPIPDVPNRGPLLEHLNQALDEIDLVGQNLSIMHEQLHDNAIAAASKGHKTVDSSPA